MKSSLGSSMGAITDFECEVTTCDSEKCNDLKSDGGEGEKGGKEEEDSSFAVHTVSVILFSAILGLLF